MAGSRSEQRILQYLHEIRLDTELLKRGQAVQERQLIKIDTKLDCVVIDVQRHDQTLYGEDKKNGMKKTLADAKDQIKTLFRFMWIVLGIALLATSSLFIRHFL